MEGIKRVSSEIYNASLETLCFEDMPEWEHWEPSQGHQSVLKFHRLCKLSIVNCPKLLEHLPQHLPSLEQLVIKECMRLAVFLSDLPMLRDLDIYECQNVVCSCPFNSKQIIMSLSSILESENCSIQMLRNVEELMIDNCDDLVHSWQHNLSTGMQLEEVPSLTYLTKLSISDCQNVFSFPECFILPNLNELEIQGCSSLIAVPPFVHKSPHLEFLDIELCDSLKFIAKVQLPPSLKYLCVCYCEGLECLVDDREDICTLSPWYYTSTMINNSISPLLEYLDIKGCPSLMCLSSTGTLPTTVRCLEIGLCPKLQSIGEMFDDNTSLEYIRIDNCENLISIPDGLHELNCLREIYVSECASLVSFAERGLPSNISTFEIIKCEKLQAPPSCIYSLNSLEALSIPKCPGLTSLIEEGLPINLTKLEIEDDLYMYKRLFQWGLHRLTSLRAQGIQNCQDAVCFPEERMSMTLPPSLVELEIDDFPKLEYLSYKGFENLTSLESLWICNCPNLRSLPEQGLPSSLLELDISKCPLLKKRCKRGKGQDWHKIAHIPCVVIDRNFVYDSEEE